MTSNDGDALIMLRSRDGPFNRMKMRIVMNMFTATRCPCCFLVQGQLREHDKSSSGRRASRVCDAVISYVDEGAA